MRTSVSFLWSWTCLDRHTIRDLFLSERCGPHINNNGGPSSLMTDHTTSVGRDTNDMTVLRGHITTQLRQLEVQRPSLLSERVAVSDCVLSKTPFFLYLERGIAQDLQTIRSVVDYSQSPTPRWAPKTHHLANKTQEGRCARSCGTNVFVLEHTRDKFTSPPIVLQTHENEFE